MKDSAVTSDRKKKKKIVQESPSVVTDLTMTETQALKNPEWEHSESISTASSRSKEHDMPASMSETSRQIHD